MMNRFARSLVRVVLFTLIVLCVQANFAAAQIIFSDAVFPVGYHPRSLVVSNINGDSQPDIVTVNEGGTVSVLLSSSGVFTTAATYTVGDNPTAIALADFNGDGKPDIVTANIGASGSGNTVSVLLNNGDGTFAAKNDSTVGIGVCAVAAADVNEDGKPRYSNCNISDGTVSVLLNTGAGFAPKIDYIAGVRPSAVAVADVNGDGKLDIVTTNIGSGTSAGSTASVLLNTGSGVFASKIEYPVNAGAYFLTLSDVNGDRKPDIVTTNNDDIITGLWPFQAV